MTAHHLTSAATEPFLVGHELMDIHSHPALSSICMFPPYMCSILPSPRMWLAFIARLISADALKPTPLSWAQWWWAPVTPPNVCIIPPPMGVTYLYSKSDISTGKETTSLSWGRWQQLPPNRCCILPASPNVSYIQQEWSQYRHKNYHLHPRTVITAPNFHVCTPHPQMWPTYQHVHRNCSLYHESRDNNSNLTCVHPPPSLDALDVTYLYGKSDISIGTEPTPSIMRTVTTPPTVYVCILPLPWMWPTFIARVISA